MAWQEAVENLFENMSTPIGDLAGGARLEGLLHELRVDRRGHLQGTASEATTIHETSFFRDAKVWESLAAEVMPRLVEARKGRREVRVWCAGCSTGQEVYSAAMLLCEARLPAEWRVTVLGTDEAQVVIDYARRGCFRAGEAMDGLGQEMRERYFVSRAGRWEVGRQLREMCSFDCWSVCGRFPRLPVIDLVLMRNVLPYMDAKCRREAFRDVRRQMAEDGRLLLGAMEEAEEAAEWFVAESLGDGYVYRPIAS